MSAPKFKFGEWLPDQADLDNPGVTEAKNVLRISGNYQPYLPYTPTAGFAVLPQGLPVGGIRIAGVANNSQIYVATTSGVTGNIYQISGPWTDVTPSGGWNTFNAVSFAQYSDNIFVANGAQNPQFTTNAVGGFAKLTGPFGDAPVGAILGRIGQFLMVGDLSGGGGAAYSVQWSGIDAPFDWPTPNSNDAIAEQSGLQVLDAALNRVLGISQGDQWGLLLCDGGLVRVTYTGGGTVFDFDTIYRAPGPLSQDAWIKVGPLVYYASPAGFFVTDGTTTQSIGRGKVDQYYANRLDTSNLSAVRCGVDFPNRLIYWTLPKKGDNGNPQEMMVYNFEEQKWTHVFDTVRAFISHEDATILQNGMQVLGNNSRLGLLNGPPGTATLTSPELELNPGGLTMVSGVNPQVSGASQLNVRIASRIALTQALTLTPAISPTPSTGFADILVESHYLRAQMDIVGPFTQALGGEFLAESGGPF